MSNVAAYLLGAATPIVLLVVGAYLLDWRTSIRDWRRGYGKGFYHDHEAHLDGRWQPVQHTHKWPNMTPWFIVKAAEPLIRSRCESKPGRRPEETL